MTFLRPRFGNIEQHCEKVVTIQGDPSSFFDIGPAFDRVNKLIKNPTRIGLLWVVPSGFSSGNIGALVAEDRSHAFVREIDQDIRLFSPFPADIANGPWRDHALVGVSKQELP